MKSKVFKSVLFTLISIVSYSQTEIHVTESSGVGINIDIPDDYFHIEVPDSYFNDGLHARINRTGNQDIRAIKGHSITNPGYGIGGHFTGGFRGVYALGSGGTYAGSFPVYGLYAESTGNTGKRVGLFARASGGTENIAAHFGAGDVEIDNMLRINTSSNSGRVQITNSEVFGSNATALRIIANNDGPETAYGNLISGTNSGTGNMIGNYVTISANGPQATAYANYAITNGPNDFAYYGFGNGYISGDLRIGQNVDPYGGSYKVVVDGRILSEEVRVQNSLDWPDYVFRDDYNLISIAAVERHIKEYGHLPNIPPAEQIEKEGIDVGGMHVKLMEKIEELTLYLIAQQKEIDELTKLINAQIDEK